MSYVIRMSSGPTGLGCIALQTDLILLPGTCDVQEIQAVCIVCVPKAGTPAVSFFSTRGVQKMRLMILTILRDRGHTEDRRMSLRNLS